MFCARNSILVKKLTKIFQNKCGQVVKYKLYMMMDWQRFNWLYFKDFENAKKEARSKVTEKREYFWFLEASTVNIMAWQLKKIEEDKSGWPSLFKKILGTYFVSSSLLFTRAFMVTLSWWIVLWMTFDTELFFCIKSCKNRGGCPQGQEAFAFIAWRQSHRPPLKFWVSY